tara:strand:+ start:1471 stop:1896 length:426 start_codon:yes stop_codon:yes gene_type:complete
MDEAVQEETSSVDMDKLAAVYIKIRDKRAVIKKEFDEKDKGLEEQMQLIANEMLDACKRIGADSIKTQHGTIIRSVKSRYWTNDWDSMYSFIEEQGAFGLLEKRLHQTNMKDFLSENPDLYPVGLNVENSYTVVVRRSKEN